MVMEMGCGCGGGAGGAGCGQHPTLGTQEFWGHPPPQEETGGAAVPGQTGAGGGAGWGQQRFCWQVLGAGHPLLHGVAGTFVPGQVPEATAQARDRKLSGTQTNAEESTLLTRAEEASELSG